MSLKDNRRRWFLWVAVPAFWAWSVAGFAQEEAGSLAEPSFTYQPANGRDPFSPLTGSGAPSFSGPDEEAPFDPKGVTLTGLISSKGGRWAILKGGQGKTYMVKEGKIWDAKRKPVQNFVGIVKAKSLVLIGPNNQVTELKLEKKSDKDQGE